MRTDISTHTENVLCYNARHRTTLQLKNRKMCAIKSHKQGRYLSNSAFILFAFRTIKEYISVVLSHLICSNLLQWLQIPTLGLPSFSFSISYSVRTAIANRHRPGNPSITSNNLYFLKLQTQGTRYPHTHVHVYIHSAHTHTQINKNLKRKKGKPFNWLQNDFFKWHRLTFTKLTYTLGHCNENWNVIFSVSLYLVVL